MMNVLIPHVGLFPELSHYNTFINNLTFEQQAYCVRQNMVLQQFCVLKTKGSVLWASLRVSIKFIRSLCLKIASFFEKIESHMNLKFYSLADLPTYTQIASGKQACDVLLTIYRPQKFLLPELFPILPSYKHTL